MLDLLWLVPAVPFASAALLALFGPRLPRKGVPAIAVLSIAISAVVAFAIAGSFFGAPPAENTYTQRLWTWMDVAGFRPEIAWHLDALSLVMILVITFVAFLIHLYSTEFMRGDEGYSRFFAYMNLFVASMLTLVLADNLLLLYLGWEGVGLCSYLLIGFWYQDPANGRAGQKAFIVTRIGDTAMAIGFLLLFHSLGTLRIQDLMSRAASQWPSGSGYAVAAAALLLGGAVGKSAQLPLQTWLPDAMAGPTPTSALIHAATMVTAGVYLIARTHVLFELAPPVQLAVAVVGAATLLLAGFSALVQTDIKRVLAYSTMSQIGYMFLALGVGAWSAAIFHFMTHAFFKALLFLAAGIVIEALHDEHNMHRMGGLRKALPVAFWAFLIGGCSLAGLPLITAGAHSKDWILASAAPNKALWIAAIAGVVLTSLYTFRLIFLVFLGPLRTPVTKKPGYAMQIPVWVLAFLSIVGGFDKGAFRTFMASVFPGLQETPEAASSIAAALAFLAGIYGASLYVRRPATTVSALKRLWLAGWGFDWIYDRLFVRPILWAARINRADIVDSLYDGIAALTRAGYRALTLTETGRVRWYAAAIAGGSVLFIAMVIFL
jgi:NADH-quinone oxidoreductase subunit L